MEFVKGFKSLGKVEQDAFATCLSLKRLVWGLQIFLEFGEEP